jgi:hypothetical protein
MSATRTAAAMAYALMAGIAMTLTVISAWQPVAETGQTVAFGFATLYLGGFAFYLRRTEH